ncbi:hypothetical protein Ccr5_gp220c [Caulobacter phage Ccr5]|nr:hypothetical protein Ccr5_gp220c [Caulobacter phage Ccr5]
MNSIQDLIAKLNQPGARLAAVAITVGGVEMQPSPAQAQVRGVVEATPDAIWMDNGKMMPIGCQANYVFDGSPDRFVVDIGVSKITYEIAQGVA